MTAKKITWTKLKLDYLFKLRRDGTGYLDIAAKMSALFQEPYTEWLVTNAFRKNASPEDISLYDNDWLERRGERTLGFKDSDNPKYDTTRACFLHLQDLFYNHPERRPKMITVNGKREIAYVD